MPAKLSVNLNAVAMLRNRRDLPWPSVTGLGRIALAAGAHGLTVHPRPDERHTRFSDLAEIRALIDDEFPQAEFNVEGYPTEEFLRLVEKHQPDQVTLVPDDPAQATSDHGWDFIGQASFLKPIVARLKRGGFRVSLFADPDPAQVPAARDTGTDRIELYTGPYGSYHSDYEKARKELEKLGETADAALAAGLAVNAGHDLVVANLPALVKRIPGLAEVSIGHGLTADALEYGMSATTRRFLAACGWPA
jgi:pyridoxine 5-phosphate synthase